MEEKRGRAGNRVGIKSGRRKGWSKHLFILCRLPFVRLPFPPITHSSVLSSLDFLFLRQSSPKIFPPLASLSHKSQLSLSLTSLHTDQSFLRPSFLLRSLSFRLIFPPTILFFEVSLTQRPFLYSDHLLRSLSFRLIFPPTILFFEVSLTQRPFLSSDHPFSYDPYPSD